MVKTGEGRDQVKGDNKKIKALSKKKKKQNGMGNEGERKGEQEEERGE